jgi:hypothetical protein
LGLRTFLFFGPKSLFFAAITRPAGSARMQVT